MTQYNVLCYMLSKIEEPKEDDKNLFPQGIGTYGIDVTNLDHPLMETRMYTKDNQGKISFGLGKRSENSEMEQSLTVTSNNIKDLKGVKYTITKKDPPIKGKYAVQMPTAYKVVAEDISGRKQEAHGFYANFSFTTENDDLKKKDLGLIYDLISGLFPNHPDIKEGGSQKTKKSLKKGKN